MSVAAPSTEWFVAADGGASGDGSRESPFHDLWRAIYNAGPGDTIHLAVGTYFGRYDRSSWVIDCPNLTIRGGYSRDFSSRTPWQTPSILAMFAECEATRENNMITWRGDHSGLTLDGLFFDSAGANLYGEKPFDAIRSYPNMAGAMASFNAEGVTIKNCVWVNGANGGVELSGSGSRFENNLLLNMIGTSMLDLRSSSTLIEQPIVVRNNGFCFIHDVKDPPGGGGDAAIGVRVNCPAAVQDNIFVSCGNAAISVFIDPGRVSIDRNLFYLTPRAVVRSYAQGDSGEITEKNFDELEDIGFKSCADNIVQNPGIAGLKREWLDGYSRHLLANYAKPPRETANAARVAAGLPALNPSDLETTESKGALAPRFGVADALSFKVTAKQGVHPVELQETIAAQAARPMLVYRQIEWDAIGAPDAALANSRVELCAGLGAEQNSTLLSDASPETHMGVQIFQPGSEEMSIYVLIPRNTLPARQYQDGTTYTRGLEVETAYRLRGVYRTDVQSSRQKVTLVIESVVPTPFVVAKLPSRPEGRDWFVRAGSSGGDGSQEKPFRDPFQALDKAEGGDAIHVASGDYFGKLHAGKWRIAIRNLTLLGGYNSDFSVRDPWENPVCFLLSEEERAKGRPEGTILGSDENCDGLILDGFVFDGSTWNQYAAGGSIDLDQSPIAPLIDLGGGRAPITVRNCIFVNGSSGAVNISCPFGAFENNVVLNTSGASLVLRAEGPGPWSVRNNTILFAGDPTERAGTGESSSDGTLLRLNGRAVVDVQSNIFAFADNYGVRSCVPQQNASFDNNVFAANLFNHLTDAEYLWADSSNWERSAVADSGFASFRANKLELPKLPVDPKFADVALTRLFTLPSRISSEQWKVSAARIGSSAAPSSPAETVPVESDKPATPAAAPSLNDLLARLGHLETQRKQAEEAPKTERPAPSYCPVFDWKKALALAQETAEAEPGAHRRKLAVAFSAQQSRPVIEYTRVTSQEIDTKNVSLDNQPIELDVTELRDSSTNSSLFAPGTDRSNFAACTVTAVDGPTRTRIAIVVKLDTAAAKTLNRITPTDKVRIRGIARRAPDSQILSIVVDTAALAGD